MSTISQRATMAGIALTLGAGVAQAQIPQNVDYPILRTGSGAAYAIDFARGNGDAGDNTRMSARSSFSVTCANSVGRRSDVTARSAGMPVDRAPI